MVRVRWLLGNAVRITHAPLLAPAAAGSSNADSDRFPHDRPWMADVLLSTPDLYEEESELEPRIVDGCLQVLNPYGQAVLSEAASPRLGLRRISPYLSLDLPKMEMSGGVRSVSDGVQIYLSIEPDEIFYGWGEQFTAFSRRFGQLRLSTRDALAPLQGRGETYSAIPCFFSSRGYAMLLLNSHPSTWKIDPDTHRLVIEVAGPPADYLLIRGPGFKRLVKTYTQLTGRPALPPRWAFGLWSTCYPQGHQDEVLRQVEEHRKRAIPLDAVILDYHWEAGFHNFRWRSSLFPDPGKMIKRLKELGVRLGLILTPFMNRRELPFQKQLLHALAHNQPPQEARGNETALEEYEEGLKHDYFAHPAARWWFGEGGMLDFTNHSAVQWWNNKMRLLYQQGVDFFKNDDGEYLPADGHSALGMDGNEYHNIYGYYYSRAQYLDMESQGRRGLVYARSAWVGSQRFPALFLGDQKPTFAHIRRTMRAGLSLSLLGFAYWTADTFGLDGRTTPELHMRYAQWALLNPVARYFWRPPEVDDTRLPWSHNRQVEDNFRLYANLRYRLLPFFNTLAWEAYLTGLPILRPLRLEFEDPSLAEIDDQILIGDRLMICPVTEPNAEFRHIYLPEGTWHDFWSPKSWDGPAEIDYPVKIHTLPLLCRGGTILPLGPVMDSIPPDHRFNEVTLHFWPPWPAAITLYDDDGTSLDYQQGKAACWQVTAEGSDQRLRIHISPAQSLSPGQRCPAVPDVRRVELIIHETTLPYGVWVERQIWNAWGYTAAKQETYIRMDCPTDRETHIQIDFH